MNIIFSITEIHSENDPHAAIILAYPRTPAYTIVFFFSISECKNISTNTLY